MKKKITLAFVLITISTAVTTAQDWSHIPVSAYAGPGNVWELQEALSDDFNYWFNPVNYKTNFGNNKWYNFYHNHWDGPGTTYWKYNHVKVDGSALVLKATRWYKNAQSEPQYPYPGATEIYKMGKQYGGINAGCVSSNARVTYPVFVEASISVANIALASCFWLLSPDDTEEIDIIENYGGVDWFKQFTHISHHSFVRDPFHDYQPRDWNSWWPDSRVNGNYGWGDWCWNKGNRQYLRLGVYWVSPKHFEYHIDGEVVRVLYHNAIATKIDNIWHYTYYNEIHSHGTTDARGSNIGGQPVNDESGYSAVTTYTTNNDAYSFATLQAASNASNGICVIDPGWYQGGNGFTKELDIIINVESQSWLVSQDKTPSNDDLNDPGKNEMRVDWIRVYKPVSSTQTGRSVTNNIEIQEVNIYPNPSNGQFTIRFPKEVKEQNIRIYDIKGHQVYSDIFSGNEHQFQLNNASGIYLLKTEYNGETLQKKLIIK